MRFSIVSAIYRKEMLDLVRDRRTLISMLFVPTLLIPLLFSVGTRLVSRIQTKAEEEAKSMAVGVKVSSSLREALERAQIQIVETDNLKDAVLTKTIAAGVEETAGTPVEVEIYADNSNPTSSAAAARGRGALGGFQG